MGNTFTASATFKTVSAGLCFKSWLFVKWVAAWAKEKRIPAPNSSVVLRRALEVYMAHLAAPGLFAAAGSHRRDGDGAPYPNDGRWGSCQPDQS